MKTVKLGDVEVGDGHLPYVIAEIGSNHNGDMDLCRRLIDAAVDAGADAVKFQSWSDKSLVSRVEYERNTDFTDKKRHFGSLEAMVKAYQFTADQHHEAAGYCREKGVTFCSSPFANDEIDLLVEVGVPFLKIASMDIVNLPLLRHAARTGKPILLSTGMATLGEIEQAIATIRAQGNEQIVPLHCISIYPPEPETINLRNIEMLRDTFELPVGFSDHSIGTSVPLAAITLGACLVEKHFTIDKDMEGWDHWISADPAELEVICRDGRMLHTALGHRERVVSDAEMEKRRKFRRSLVAARDLPAGHVLTENDLEAKRPGTHIAPDEMQYVIGRPLERDVRADDVLEWSDLG